MRRWVGLGLIALAGCAGLLGVQEVTYEAADAGAGDAGADAARDAAGDAGDAGGGPCAAQADLQTDPKNCGVCGHDCLGGACRAGQCQPYVVLAAASSTVADLVVDDTNVYFTAGDLVQTCPKSSCGVPGVLASSQTQYLNNPAYSLTVDDTDVYWVAANEIRHVGKDGGAWAAAIAGQNVDEMRLAGPNVVYRSNLDGGAFVRASKDGGGAVLLGAEPNFVGDIVLGATDYAYFTTLFQHTVRRCGLDACDGGPIDLVDASDPNSAASSITESDAGIVWAVSSAGVLLRCADEACDGGPSVIVHDEISPQSGRLLGASLFWVSGNDVVTCDDVSACVATRRVLASSTSGSPSVARPTTDAVYFAVDKTIWRVAR